MFEGLSRKNRTKKVINIKSVPSRRDSKKYIRRYVG